MGQNLSLGISFSFLFAGGFLEADLLERLVGGWREEWEEFRAFGIGILPAGKTVFTTMGKVTGSVIEDVAKVHC